MRTLAVLSCLLAPAALQAAQLLVNPSFESPIVTPGSYLNAVNPGDITGWTLIGTTVLVMNQSYSDVATYPASDGVQSLELTGLGVNLSGVQQAVPTVSGSKYWLSFDVGDKFIPGVGWASPTAIELLINGVSQGIYTNTAVTSDTSWKKYTVLVTASGPSTTIGFRNTNLGTDSYAGFDDTSFTLVPPVAGVPEPGTFALLSSPLAILFALRRMRRRP